MKITELIHGVPKGSQKRKLEPQATDDPDKYVGKWEAYDTPQGIGSVKKKKVKEDGSLGSNTSRFAPDDAIPADQIYPTDIEMIKRSRKAPLKTVRKSVKALSGPLHPQLSEALNRTYPYKLAPGSLSDDLDYVFTTDNGATINVQIKTMGAPDMWRIEFYDFGALYNKQKYDSENRFAILATVVRISLEFMNREKPYAVYIAPANKHLANIYTKLLNQYIGQLGYQIVNNDSAGIIVKQKEPVMAETIRKVTFGIINAEFEVVGPDEKPVGVCEVTDNVVTKLMALQGADEAFLGQIISSLLNILVRRADKQNAPLSMELAPDRMSELKPFLERFGFRLTNDNIMKRVAGSITPPSVAITPGL